MGGALRWLDSAIDRLIPVVVVLAVFATVIGVIHVARSRGRPIPAERSRDIALMAALLVVLVGGLWGGSRFARESNLELLPFVDLARALTDRGSLSAAIAEPIANVILFVPLGWALRRRFPGLGVGQVTAIAFGLSLGIEALQYVLVEGRFATTTDVLMNSLGGLIGAWLARGDPESDVRSG
jgi:hypothetical protein